MYGVAFIILLPLFGWWLIRATRSYERMVVAANENNVDLGFLTIKRKANVLLLFADPTFVVWLIGRKYEARDFPLPVARALDEARRSYLLVIAGIATFLLITIGLLFGASS